jgi:hypothetical protein
MRTVSLTQCSAYAEAWYCCHNTALRQPRKSLPAPLRRFIAQYEAGLPDGVADDERYELRLRVVNELAPRHPDALAIIGAHILALSCTNAARSWSLLVTDGHHLEGVSGDKRGA